VSRDRRAGVALFVVAALALGITTALTDSVLPPVRHDEGAYAELVALLDANESGTWIVEYDVERTIANGKSSSGSSTEARAEDVHILRAGGSANATIGDTRYLCTTTEEEGTLCQSAPASDTLGSADVVRTAVDAGAYVVTRLPSEEIAGEPAQCYRLFASGGYLPALGVETQYCFAGDGVELRAKITTVNDARTRVATRVQREPSTADLEQILAGLDIEAGSADGAGSN
jgi:hypothetical protein